MKGDTNVAKRIKCKFCENYFPDIEKFVSHLEKKHPDMIPDDMDSWQFAYFLQTGKTHGRCVVCKQDTLWNEKTHKYKRFCENPKCKEKYRETFKSRMIGKYGKTTLLNDPEQQRIMLSKRKISGTYTWQDHVHTSVYTGTYELSFLKFLDEVLMFDPEDVVSPSPHTYFYIYENKKHFYIPDFYIPSLNLEVEIKEGTNTHPKIQAVDKVKESLKDQVMLSLSSSINYIKIVEMDNNRFLDFLIKAEEKYFQDDNKDGKLSGIIMI